MSYQHSDSGVFILAHETTVALNIRTEYGAKFALEGFIGIPAGSGQIIPVAKPAGKILNNLKSRFHSLLPVRIHQAAGGRRNQAL